MPLSECFFLAQPFRCSLSSPQLYQELPYINLQLTVVHKSLMICCDSDLLPYSTVRLCAFQRGIPASLQSAFITGSARGLNSVFADVHGDTFLMYRALFPDCSSATAIIGVLKTIPYFLQFLMPLRAP
ncbi:hypothetical protein T01_3144 [Trichinella spiralis]|uniref:Uncharacterized protein n=1 Tax=Trichinella spiralis TaxID=6334 RepID=A0A0V1BV10_TRISP|nr:hypothetical protein T01_3144 [Trichinella spiralis]